jgi:hypothetical protein
MTFEDARQQIMASGEPSSGLDLDGMEVDFDEYLPRCPALTTVKVTQTDNPDALIVADCVAHPTASPDAVEEQLRETWQEDLRYGYREAHQVRRSRDRVKLDFVTQIGEREFYVTGTITVRWP